MVETLICQNRREFQPILTGSSCTDCWYEPEALRTGKRALAAKSFSKDLISHLGFRMLW